MCQLEITMSNKLHIYIQKRLRKLTKHLLQFLLLIPISDRPLSYHHLTYMTLLKNTIFISSRQTIAASLPAPHARSAPAPICISRSTPIDLARLPMHQFAQKRHSSSQRVPLHYASTLYPQLHHCNLQHFSDPPHNDSRLCCRSASLQSHGQHQKRSDMKTNENGQRHAATATSHERLKYLAKITCDKD